MVDPDDSSSERKPVKKAAWVRGAEASSVGIEIAVSICIPMVAAYYLERHVTHWSPWTTLIGVLFGLMAAVLAVRRVARQYQAQLRADASTDDEKKSDRD